MTEEQRMEMMERLKARHATHKCPECGTNTYCAIEDGKSGNLCWCMNEQTTKVFDHHVCVCKNCLTGS